MSLANGRHEPERMLYLTGIHDARQLAGFDPASWTGRRRRIAIDLIDDIDRLERPDLRSALFERIVDARGAFKRTYPDRFAAFDEQLAQAWRAASLPASPPHVLDVAVSDGSTSLAFVALVERLTNGVFRFTATDLDGRYQLVWRTADPTSRVILNDAGQIVQIVKPPFLFTHRESRYLFPLNRLLRPGAERFGRALIAAWRNGDAGVSSREVLLFNPGLRRLLVERAHVQFRPWDILEPWLGDKADCVRAMNVLNPDYFDAAQMSRVLRNLFDALSDGGLLAIGSNEDAGSQIDGVICRRAGDRLEMLATSGLGFRAPDALAALLA